MSSEPRTPKYLTAAEAAARLGVHRSTLYAYVSRGQLRAEPDPLNAHASRYVTTDVERLRDRKQARLHPGDAARKTLHFGLPVLQSAITLIENGRMFYRGQDALHLARAATFEDAIGVLWQSDSRPASHARAMFPASLRAVMRPLAPADRLQTVLPFVGRADRHPRDANPQALATSGWRIIGALLAAATMREWRRGTSIAAHLASVWHARDEGARALIDAALVLCADHELNVSTFAVRVAASAGSSPYDAVLAGLCALRGSRHGGQTELVEQLLDEARSPGSLRAAMERRLRDGEPVPGFGHLLYPDGDPRSRLLCEMIADVAPRSAAVAWTDAIRGAGTHLLSDFPNVDIALVLVRRALRLPRGAAFLIFALGRSAGWIAHAMEQYASASLIRPRALYSGPRHG